MSTIEDGIRYLVVCTKKNCRQVWACSRYNGKTKFCRQCKSEGITCVYQLIKVHQIETKRYLDFICPLCSGTWWD